MSAATSAKAPANAPVDDRAIAERSRLARILASEGTWVLLVDIFLIFAFTVLSESHVFWSIENLKSQLLNGSEGLLLALAATLLLGAGLFDLSIGANLVFSSVIGAWVMITAAGGTPIAVSSAGGQTFTNVPFAIAIGLVTCISVGALIGLLNGFLIAYLEVNSLIATLGTFGIATGMTLVIVNGSDIAGLPHELGDAFGRATVGRVIPYPAVVALAVAIGLWALMKFTGFGLHTLAIGSSTVAAERAGLPVKRHVLKVTALAGSFCGLAGFLSLAHYSATTVNGHGSDALAAITAAVIGGTYITGGFVTVLGTIWGTALAGILLGGLVIVGVQSFYQQVAIGIILILAVALDRWRARRRESR